MKKLIVLASLCLLGSTLAVGAQTANADVRVNASIGSGHTGIYFSNEPDVVVVPGTRVYYEDSGPYDVYRYGRMWYVMRNGTWYRASTYRGPFVMINYERVPHQVIVLPVEYRHHDNGRWHNNGHRHGHDRGDDDDQH
ncbi:MAG TPA: hypothetical protein VKF80_09745 [Candidatus Eisenbacteria bacterium]|nr:hypothetical protein [Candidatus Eisenbacteria bacterium]